MSLGTERALAMPAVHECHGINRASRGRMALRSALMRLALVLVICCPMWAGAQDSTASPDSTAPREGWIIGPLVGMSRVARERGAEALTVGLSFASLDSGRVGVDILIGTLPTAIEDGIVAFGFRFDAAYPVPVSQNLLLLPAAGFSLVGGLSGEAMEGAMGLNAGLAAVIHGASPFGLRLGVTEHRFVSDREPIYLIEVGVVHMRGSRRAGRP